MMARFPLSSSAFDPPRVACTLRVSTPRSRKRGLRERTSEMAENVTFEFARI